MVRVASNHGISPANVASAGPAAPLGPAAAPRLADVVALDAAAPSLVSARADLTPAAQLERFADPVELGTTKNDDLVLNTYSKAGFDRLEGRIRQQDKLLKNWAFATRGGTQPGIVGAFEGGAGQGKSLAARVLAVRLDRPLYELDFSKVVGDTASQTLRNISGAIDAAAMAGAILLIEDINAVIADGSKDHSDRDARLIGAGLAQKLRKQAGVVLLVGPNTTSLGSEIGMVLTEKVSFPFPDAQQRREIWKRVFPADTPVDTLPLDNIAQHGLTGAQISSAALRAAALAAEAGHGITSEDIKKAVQAEYQAAGRSSSSHEFNY